ncbi:hypothetical protein NQ314_004414 [Rhamnusium bicolor]|uniref:Gamma-interferon-inducible lysosomal thiol reductase n=1 Tax=Rhamnusium bicolor TaxID=1586634 RepID=A0AAV8ZJJ5_9CUCU|nr:hypothetical protein NQ314_004414 [Rhamnusium bicolor]
MWKITFNFFAFCVCLSMAAKIKVSVFYESLCPDSINFTVTQLTPAYEIIADKIDLDFVPFGFAIADNESGEWNFTCQHGDGECYGNKVHSCALALFPKEISTQFVLCAMASDDSSSEENLRECAATTKIAWPSLQQCLTSGKADELLAANGIRTSSVDPSIDFIPTIIYNDIYSDPLESLSLTSFLDLVEFLSEESECGACHFK